MNGIIKCITVQHASVLKTFRRKDVYHATMDRVSENLKGPYEFMRNLYGYEHDPIFLCPVGHLANFYGAKLRPGSVALEFDIPEELCRVQEYYEWTDFVYYSEFPNEFKEKFDPSAFPDMKSYGEYVLTKLKPQDMPLKKTFYQITVPELRLDWLVDAKSDLKKLDDLHGCANYDLELQSLNNY